MTFQKDPIQSLIDEIDGILHKANSHRPWPMSSEVAQHRRVLERVRGYLVFQQQKTSAPLEPPQVESAGQEAARQIARAVIKEMESLRTNLMQPLQAELEALRRERESLIREIRHLENRHQHYNSLGQQQAKQQQIISDFLQVLMGPLQESLTQQVAKTLANLETSQVDKLESYNFEELSNLQSSLHPLKRLEQLRQMQTQYDQQLINLDSTLRVVLEALQRNILGYQESLSQGVAKMHKLGQQGEVLFTALVKHLAQQLGSEASSYLKGEQMQLSEEQAKTGSSSFQPTEETRKSSLSPKSKVQSQTPNFQTPSLADSSGQFPFPGIEIPPSRRELVQPPKASQGSAIAKSVPPKESSLQSDLNPENWDIFALDLNNLNFEPIGSDEIHSTLQFDIDSLVSESPPLQEKQQQNSASSQSSQESAPERMKSLPDSRINEDSIHQTSFILHPSESSDNWLGFQQQHEDALAVSSDSNKELDDLYTILFGESPPTDTLDPDEFELLTHSTPQTVFNLHPQVDATNSNATDLAWENTGEESSFVESQAPSINPQSPASPPAPLDHFLADSVNPNHPGIEDSLFETLAQTAPPISLKNTQPQTPSVQQPNPSSESWEEVLFYEDVTGASNQPLEADVTRGTATDVKTNSPLFRSLSEVSEGVETITALTDLFKETELRVTEEKTPPAELHYEQQPPDTGSDLEVVEDSYIPAPLEENLLVMDESQSEPDIKLLLDQNTLQLLSEDLFSFESLDSRNQVHQKHLPRTDEKESTPLTSRSPLQSPTEEDKRGLSPEESLTLVQANPPRSQPATVTYELLAEDWEDFALDSSSPNGDDSTPPTAITGATTDSSVEEEVALVSTKDDIAESTTSLDPNEVNWNPDSLPLEALNWQQERASSPKSIPFDLAKEEEVFTNWTLDEAQQRTAPAQIPPTDWDWEALNRALEGAINQGEEAFTNWTLDEDIHRTPQADTPPTDWDWQLDFPQTSGLTNQDLPDENKNNSN